MGRVARTGRADACTQTPSADRSARKVTCRFWAQGRCDRGSACRFLHGSGGREATMFEGRINTLRHECPWLRWHEAKEIMQVADGDVRSGVELTLAAASSPFAPEWWPVERRRSSGDGSSDMSFESVSADGSCEWPDLGSVY